MSRVPGVPAGRLNVTQQTENQTCRRLQYQRIKIGLKCVMSDI